MLYTIDKKDITVVPHAPEYKAWRHALDQLDPLAFDRIHAFLTDKFDQAEVQTSSWIPNGSWMGTDLQPIWEAVGRNREKAGLFFGLLVWQVVMDHPDNWAFMKVEKSKLANSPDASAATGTTYFRIQI